MKQYNKMVNICIVNIVIRIIKRIASLFKHICYVWPRYYWNVKKIKHLEYIFQTTVYVGQTNYLPVLI